MRDLKRLKISIGLAAMGAMMSVSAPAIAKSKHCTGSKGKQVSTEAATEEQTDAAVAPSTTFAVELPDQEEFEKNFDSSKKKELFFSLLLKNGNVFADENLKNSANEYIEKGYLVVDLKKMSELFNYGIGIKGRYFTTGFLAISEDGDTFTYVVKCSKKDFSEGKKNLKPEAWNIVDENRLVSRDELGAPYDEITFNPEAEIATYKRIFTEE